MPSLGARSLVLDQGRVVVVKDCMTYGSDWVLLQQGGVLGKNWALHNM